MYTGPLSRVPAVHGSWPWVISAWRLDFRFSGIEAHGSIKRRGPWLDFGRGAGCSLFGARRQCPHISNRRSGISWTAFHQDALSGYDHGEWKDASPIWIVETQENAVDVIAAW